MYCMKCGSEIADGVSFCPHCGQKAGEQPVRKDRLGGIGETVTSAVGKAADKLYETTGGTGHAELKFRDFFSEVFKKHERRESEEIFICGTETTTPAIEDVRADWPKPWVWSRVFAALLITLALLYALYIVFENAIAIPGIMFIGALVAPFSLLVFFFETNIPRNISLVETISIFFIGGVASLIALYLLPGNLLSASGSGDIVPSMLTGFLEETAKVVLIVVVFQLRKDRGTHYVLNGLLIGAAIGAGFAVFETAGYIYLLSNTTQDMTTLIALRGLLAVGGHVAWAAAEGAALALGEAGKPVELGQVVNPVSLSVFVLKNPAFLAVFISCIVLHGVWDMSTIDFLDTFFLKYAILIVIIWIIIMVMLNRGLDQINQVTEAADAGEAPSHQTPESSSAPDGAIAQEASVESVESV